MTLLFMIRFVFMLLTNFIAILTNAKPLIARRSFLSKEIFEIGVKDTEELNLVVENLPITTKAIWIGHTRPLDYSALEKLTGLQTVYINLAVNDVLWNMEKTPNLDVLEIALGARAPSVESIKTSKSLRHIGFMASTSQINKTVIPTFSFFKEMPNLDSLVLSGVASQDGNIDDLIDIPKLRRLWISPDVYDTEEYAKFESLKFKIFDEYGIYKHDNEANALEESRPLGKGKRYFKDKKAKEKFVVQYGEMMKRYK